MNKRTKIFDAFKRINLREEQINRIRPEVETVGHSDGEGFREMENMRRWA